MCFHTYNVLFITRGILEMKLQNVMCDRKHLYESQSVQLREKNRYRMMSDCSITHINVPTYSIKGVCICTLKNTDRKYSACVILEIFKELLVL